MKINQRGGETKQVAPRELRQAGLAFRLGGGRFLRGEQALHNRRLGRIKAGVAFGRVDGTFIITLVLAILAVVIIAMVVVIARAGDLDVVQDDAEHIGIDLAQLIEHVLEGGALGDGGLDHDQDAIHAGGQGEGIGDDQQGGRIQDDRFVLGGKLVQDLGHADRAQ